MLIFIRKTFHRIGFLWFSLIFCCLQASGSQPNESLPSIGFGRVNYPLERCKPEDQQFFKKILGDIKKFRDELLKVKDKKDDAHNINVACLAVDVLGAGQKPLCQKVFFGHPTLSL